MQLYQSIQTQLILTLVLLVVFVFQFNVITPLENELFPSTDLHYASLLFIPHGLKVLATYLMGIVAVPAVFIAQLLAGLLILDSPNRFLSGSDFWHDSGDITGCNDQLSAEEQMV